ncbi:DUF2946 domain-containing protein [Stutzerimonas stutzeri]|uniref:DUF2946 domain-containing protein n=1 Tax=Stutzerimonas stutzeri TaxID=316 RepID=UPI000F786DE6|nr:DUF2946 domain-containing protein [Stutzerimonas stutzeri]MBS9724989.1 DUF2946 domain-containing protein [Stutzerimonas stutzeri]MCP3430701.1 DUF2946 domain-containing protein [Stutzerimonas stutzeri]MDH0496982.1 DUF2946 domain-containing protein [Stutzerimonas stutzeri]RRW09042.1 DUF2946 domain-containing protein [Stutzerimonas stutzeri]UUC83612.1 DUF2946 domain-containing protein [Stutzerimonas stutzeri]
MNRRRLPAWLASLALLMHLLSMPLSGMLPADAKRLLGWSGHCPMQQADVSPGHAMHGAETAGEHGSGTHHGGMPPCCCCAGSIGLAALPAPSLQLPQDVQGGAVRIAETRVHRPSPRQQWPSLNPRASPLA